MEWIETMSELELLGSSEQPYIMWLEAHVVICCMHFPNLHIRPQSLSHAGAHAVPVLVMLML